MTSLESLNQAVGTVCQWSPSMSLENLNEAELDARLQAARLQSFRKGACLNGICYDSEL